VVPTVYLVGIDGLERIPEFLDLGLIVVVSPLPDDAPSIATRKGLAEPLTDRSTRAPTGVVVDMNRGEHLPRHATPLSEREFSPLRRSASPNGDSCLAHHLP
jgi:hypothetical protein